MASNNALDFNPLADHKKWKLLQDLDEKTLANIKWLKVLSDRAFYCNHQDRLFAWGQNDYGQLGIGHTHDVDTPTLMVALDGQQVVDIVGSEWTTLALTQHGQVYAWGRNDVKQIEDSREDCIPRPKHMQDLKNIVSIASGRMHSMALDKRGKMFIWGWNGNGQIGNHGMDYYGDDDLDNEDAYNQPHPIQLDMFTTEVITQIECGAYSSMVLLNNGDVFAWGSLPGEDTLTPVKLNIPNHKVKQIACAEQALVSLTHQGQVFIHRNSFTPPQLMQPKHIQFTSVIIIDHDKFDWTRSQSLVLAISATHQVYHASVKKEGSTQLIESNLSLPDVIVKYSTIQASLVKMTLNDKLKDKCMRLISQHLNVPDCCKLYELSVILSLEDLTHTIIVFARNNLAKIPKDCLNSMSNNNLKAFLDKLNKIE